MAVEGKRTYGGRYEVIEPVGSGGMAEVYRARDELLGREVAVKVLSERFARDPSFVERFRREAQRAANLSHPNIVGLYDYGSDGDTYFIVMEYIEGRTLAEVIADNGALMPERAAEIAADVGAALQRAHGSGIVHRDIKPGNIMLTSAGQTKVTDFGIARAVGGERDATMTQTGMVIGTAAYLSPEQAQGEPVDARSDIYALGCVLYESLTGSAPFTGDTPLSIAYKHVREEVNPPSRLNRDVPADLDAIVMKAMAKDPGARYNSADEMRADIERFLNGQKVLASAQTAAQTSVMAGSGTQVMRQTEMMYDDESEDRSPWFYIWITLGILLVAGIAAFFLANILGGEKVEVPGVVGLTETDARDILDEAGLGWEIERRASGKPEGEVLEQDPEEGETAEEGDKVLLVVSNGARQTEVP
ncbi:MAG: Stk1 family PASTA domain-containing Ser/Thr kinase, partial [Actinobacteria bacterium]|nr:Stk1 family PASTA domain-containing Ser/Thr kinase [Actinomycetota bacterium]